MNDSPVLIIGIGNEYRTDDAAGLLAARKIKTLGIKGIDVTENNGDGADLIEKWTGRKLVILIDAVLSGSAPGTLHRFDLPGPVLPPELFRFSTHLFSVNQAIYLSASLDKLPKRLVLIGIEAASFGAGTSLSPEVGAAVNNIENILNNEIIKPKTKGVKY
jgi:hydrogenase maturation protease